jgi:PAS domain S-box-containing protein
MNNGSTQAPIQPIVDRKSREYAEAMLQQEQQFNRTLLDSMADGVAACDADGKLVLFNRTAREWHGLDALSLPPDQSAEYDSLFAADGHTPLSAADAPLMRAFAGETVRNAEMTICATGQPPRYILVSGGPVLDQAGQKLGAVVTMHDITARKLAEQQIQRQFDSLRALHNGAQDLAQSLDSAKLARDVAHACVETFGVSLAWVGRAQPDGRVQLLTQYPLDSDHLYQTTVRWDDTPVGSRAMELAIRSDTPTVFAELNDDEQAPPAWKQALERGYRSVGAFPLISRRQTFGALVLYSKQPDYFTPERVQFFQSYALLAATALENACLYEDAERRLSQVQALRHIDTAISSGLDQHTTLDVIVDQATAQLRVDAASILLLEPHSLMFTSAAGRGFRTRAIQDTHLRLGQGYAGLAALERRTVVNDARLPTDGDHHAARYRNLMDDEDFVAHIATPLIAKGQVVGALEVFHRAPLDADAQWLAFLETLAAQAAIAIDSGGLFDSLQGSSAELGLAYDATLEGWSRALDLRDKETQGYTKRTTEITLRLARAMGINGAELIHLRRGALLHDIGKMGIPDAILLKPGPLTEEEWILMRQHPQYARDMLFPIKYLRPAIDIPYCHHEKWDGSGYPRGLTGEQIPLAARVFAVVDVWGALISNRPYRAAWPEDKVRDYIRQASTHFDPQVVKVFLQLDLKNTS